MAYSPARLISRRLLSSIADAHRRRRLSTATTIPHENTCYSPPPWLMLPPTYNARSIDYNFYNLAEKRVSTHPQTPGLSGLMPNRIQDLAFCGSSKGWITLFNPDSLDLFLYNPISLRFIKLPPIRNLTNFFPKHSHRSVTKLILSGSPDEPDCRAVMTYNCIDALAFCCPVSSKEWIPIGKTHDTLYLDMAYSSRRNQFFAINQDSDLETWDLTDLLSPRMVRTRKEKDEDYDLRSKSSMCRRDKYLVVADEELLVVGRHVMEEVGPDGSCTDFDKYSKLHLRPHLTIGFDVHVYDQEEEEFYVVESLDDTSLFIGNRSDAVALWATEQQQLKSNSVYFTDSWETAAEKDTDNNYLFGGHDIGTFDCENETVSPCYYPSDLKDLKRIVPSPMWFFPTLL